MVGKIELALEGDDAAGDVNTGKQVGDLERLGQAVVGADRRVERSALLGVDKRDQVQDSAVGLGTQAVEDREAVNLAETGIENCEVVAARLERGHHGLAV